MENGGRKRLDCSRSLKLIKDGGKKSKMKTMLFCERIFGTIDKRSKTKISLVSKIFKHLQRVNKKYHKKDGIDGSNGNIKSPLDIELISNNSDGINDEISSSNSISKDNKSIDEEPDFIKKFIDDKKYVNMIKKYKFVSALIIFFVLIFLLWTVYYYVFSTNDVSQLPIIDNDINEKLELLNRYDIGWMNALDYGFFLREYIDSFKNKTDIHQTPINLKSINKTHDVNTIHHEKDRDVWWWYHAHISSKRKDKLNDLNDMLKKSCRPLSQTEIKTSKLNLCTSLSKNSIDNDDCDDISSSNTSMKNSTIDSGYEDNKTRSSSIDLTLLYDILCHEAKRKSTERLSKYESGTKEKINMEEYMDYAFPRSLDIKDFSMSLNNPENMFFNGGDGDGNKWWKEYNPPDVCVMAVYKPPSSFKNKDDDKINPNIPKKSIEEFYIPNDKVDNEMKKGGEYLIFNSSYNPPKNAFIHASKERGFNILKRNYQIDSDLINVDDYHGFEEMISQTDYTTYEPSDGRCSLWINPEIKIIHKPDKKNERYEVKYEKPDERDIDENHYQVMHGIEYFNMPNYDNDKTKIAMKQGYEVNKFLTTIEKDIAVSYQPMKLPSSYKSHFDNKKKNNIFHGSYLWIPKYKRNAISAQLNIAMMQGKIDVINNNQKAIKKILTR